MTSPTNPYDPANLAWTGKKDLPQPRQIALRVVVVVVAVALLVGGAAALAVASSAPPPTPTTVMVTVTVSGTPMVVPSTTPTTPPSTSPAPAPSPVPTTTRRVTLDHDTTYRTDENLAKGKTKVIQAGHDGLAEQTLLNGKVVKTVTIRDPVDRIIAQGTKTVAKPAPKKTTKPTKPAKTTKPASGSRPSITGLSCSRSGQMVTASARLKMGGHAGTLTWLIGGQTITSHASAAATSASARQGLLAAQPASCKLTVTTERGSTSATRQSQ